MSRPIQKTTASGDAITLEARASSMAAGRAVAQLEHNAMQALALVRAVQHALARIARGCDRASLLLAHSAGSVDEAVKTELRRLFAELAGEIQRAAWDGEPLLCGGASTFALDDPWQESSEPLWVELPNLLDAVDGLSSAEGANATQLGQRHGALIAAVRLGQKRMTATATRLGEVLATERRGPAVAVTKRQAADDGFVLMIGRVRDRVLQSGDAALRVQGAPSPRAVWLIEGVEKAH